TLEVRFDKKSKVRTRRRPRSRSERTGGCRQLPDSTSRCMTRSVTSRGDRCFETAPPSCVAPPQSPGRAGTDGAADAVGPGESQCENGPRSRPTMSQLETVRLQAGLRQPAILMDNG